MNIFAERDFFVETVETDVRSKYDTCFVKPSAVTAYTDVICTMWELLTNTLTSDTNESSILWSLLTSLSLSYSLTVRIILRYHSVHFDIVSLPVMHTRIDL